ncbi:hypothetical protein PHYPSEUDO_015616 [Phytophthora pseudosyringae]|uniref:Uncharacterized protein n=1 Tax=Phytophthora pseudosyringae TaxID=221518 RepID=A0A8T1V337_9STRA|nr:hypothetical protein PHYPSEUDO_015616 [Phytophthora pseudosyringae]
MASSKPRGRPPADGNFIAWTEPLVESLLRLRFGKYAAPMEAARGTKSLRQAWAEMAEELTQRNSGDVVSVEQCRNKLKALRNKWLAHRAGLASEPVCLALMDVFWGSDEAEARAGKSPRQSSPSPEHGRHVKKPRVATPALTSVGSTASDPEGKTDAKALTPIAPAPAPVSRAVADPVSTSSPVPTEATETASTLAAAAEAGAGIPIANATQLLDVATPPGFADIASTAAEAARPEDNPCEDSGDLSNLEKRIDDRFAEVLERQEQQLKLGEEQNRLLAQILATLQRREHHDDPVTSTSTVYFRQQSGGSIFAIDGRDGTQTELEGSSEYARFVGLAMHRRHERLFWSDGRVVSSANAADGSDVRVVVGALARVVWVGTNFGKTRADLQVLTVKGTRCDRVVSWSSERVECIVGLPLRFSQQQLPLVGDDDCRIQTNDGSMTGIALNYNEMFASGTPSPIVERIDIDADFVLPHALAIDGREGHDWLYWSNSADGTIYRSSLRSTAIEVVQRRCWSVRGLALNIPQDSVKASGALFYSLESKGTISQIELPASNTSMASPPQAEVLLSGLRSPRGLALDCSNQTLFFTEKTGRIFQARLGQTMTARQKASLLPDDASIVAPGVDLRRIVTRTSTTRLDGVAVDSKYLYWCETNTNTVARALRRDFERQVVVGGTANSMLSWPRGIVLGSDDGDTNDRTQSYFYSEYTGRVSRGASQTIVVNALSAPAMQYLDNVVQRSAIQESGDRLYFYALE